MKHQIKLVAYLVKRETMGDINNVELGDYITCEPDDYSEDDDICDCCGRELNGMDGEDPCPFCCSHSYAPGSEEVETGIKKLEMRYKFKVF